MSMNINKVVADIDWEALDASFDVYAVQSKGKRVPYSSRVLEGYGASEIAAIASFGAGDQPFYILSRKGSTSARELQGRFEGLFEDEIAGEDLEGNTAERLVVSKVMPIYVGERVAVQLLLNALFNTPSGLSASNATGHLYLLGTGSPWIALRGDDKKPVQLAALEIRLTAEMLMTAAVTTFTWIDDPFLSFAGGRPRERYPKYVLDMTGPTMRRVMPGERPNRRDVFIIKQRPRRKNTVDYLKYKSPEAFASCKCGVLDDMLRCFNAEYEGMAGIRFAEVPAESVVEAPSRLMECDRLSKIEGAGYQVVDAAGTQRSAEAASALRDAMDALGYAVDGLVKTHDSDRLLNVRVVHDKEHYSGKDAVEDAYAADMGSQHITVEAIEAELAIEAGGKKSELETVIRKCCTELAIKDDISNGRMRLFDWAAIGLAEPMVFACPGPESEEEREARDRGSSPKRYSFIELAPDGEMTFAQGSSSMTDGGRWDELACELVSLYKPGTEGFAVRADGEINAIETTEVVPLPDLEALRRSVAETSWTATADLVERACGRPAKSVELACCLQRVAKLALEGGREQVRSTMLNKLVRDVARELDCDVSSRMLRKSLSDALVAEGGCKLASSITRTRVELERLFASLLGMRCIEHNGSLYYWMGTFSPFKDTGIGKGMVVRKVTNPYAGDMFFTGLFDTLCAPVVRLNSPTVLPLTFKYLREFMRSCEI